MWDSGAVACVNARTCSARQVAGDVEDDLFRPRKGPGQVKSTVLFINYGVHRTTLKFFLFFSLLKQVFLAVSQN